MALIITIQVLYDLSKETLKFTYFSLSWQRPRDVYFEKQHKKLYVLFRGSPAVYFVTERTQNCDNHSHIISLLIE